NDFSVDVNIAEKLVFTFSSFEQFVEGRQGEAAEAKRDNAFGGLAAGVIAGFAAANIPGAILGAIAGIIAGMMAGSSRAGEITDKSKSELKRCLCDELDKYFSHYREMYIVNIDSLKSDIDSRAEQYGRKHIRSYGEKVKLLIERQKMVNQRLNESIKKLNEYEKMLLDIEESNERELIVLRCRS
ncbi:hypothetical protein IJT93_04900, partial [bacterium]|nr:hypothetical protein [bacterium]